MGLSIAITSLMNFLSTYKNLTYLILFLGSFFETVIGFSFFVYGEIFFLTGAILAGTGVLNIWIVIIVLYAGGLLGDSTSYFLGKKYGFKLYKSLENKIFFRNYLNQKNYNKGIRLFEKYGGYSVFFARFMGPLSWITPFLAGTHKLDYKVFIKYDIPAVIFGIGQFIVIGYFAGANYKILLTLFSKYLFVIFFILLSLIIIYYYLKKKKIISEIKKIFILNKKKFIVMSLKHFTQIAFIILLFFSLFLLYLFFFSNNGITHFENNLSNRTITLNESYLSKCGNLNTYYYDLNSSKIQPINVILITDKNLSVIMNKKWVKNEIFQKNNISFENYIELLKNETLPVSDLYFKNIPQDSAYQYGTNSFLKREHIRFWHFVNKMNQNQNIYLGSISEDTGFDFRFYNHFLTPVHEINKNLDKSRDFFYNYLLNQTNLNASCTYIKTNCGIKKSKELDEQGYYTDGRILLCNLN